MTVGTLAKYCGTSSNAVSPLDILPVHYLTGLFTKQRTNFWTQFFFHRHGLMLGLFISIRHRIIHFFKSHCKLPQLRIPISDCSWYDFLFL